MPRAYYSVVIDADVDTVWRTVRDFNGLGGWMPPVKQSEIIEGPHADAVGCVRRLTLQDGGAVIERLVGLDDRARVQQYVILESPFPVQSYHATLRVAPITATKQTFAEWWTDYEPNEGASDKVPPFDQAIFAAGLNTLRDRHAKKS